MPPDPHIALTSFDPLGEALHFLRMNGVFYCRSEFSAPWALALPPMEDWLMLHVVTSGSCWLRVDGVEAQRLGVGELALVPHGQGHLLASRPGLAGAPLFELPREAVGERFEILRHGGGGEGTTVICGAFRFADPAARDLVRQLPGLIRIDSWDSPEWDWMQGTLRYIATEAREPRPGGEAVITRLADILVIQAIRAWIARAGAEGPGWLRGLRDPQIGRALALVHRDPAGGWSLPALAAAVGMSRSAFSARFTRIVGEPAIRYLARWKMRAALMWIEEDGCSAGQAAERLGYESEAAFSRAFKRVLGLPPGEARRRGRGREAPGP